MHIAYVLLVLMIDRSTINDVDHPPRVIEMYDFNTKSSCEKLRDKILSGFKNTNITAECMLKRKDVSSRGGIPYPQVEILGLSLRWFAASHFSL